MEPDSGGLLVHRDAGLADSMVLVTRSLLEPAAFPGSTSCKPGARFLHLDMLATADNPVCSIVVRDTLVIRRCARPGARE